MYILFISRGYPTEKYKGNGIFEFDQAKAVARLGHKVVFAAIDVRSIRRWRKWGFEKKNIDGVKIYCINIPLGRVPKWLLDKASIWGLRYLYRKILKEQGKPDILHAHFTDLGYIASILKRKIDIPLIITEHSSLINKLNVEENLYRKASSTYKNADALIAVSPALANRIEENFNIKPIYIPNIFDAGIFNYIPKAGHDKFNFVSTGNLIYTKRMDLTIEAFNKAFYCNDNVTLTIFGEGPEKAKLEGMISRYKLNDRVILKGMCPRSSIAEQLSYSDCFVLASQSETFGVAYIEALAMGVPVIATRCGGPEEFVHEENGLLIPVNDVDALSCAIKYMYENCRNYNREKIAKDTRSLFSPENVANKILEVYKSVVKK